MPLDGHSYLVAQGWGGKGTGLRQGAISRPLAVPQKKTLAGLGKDRDKAFPFWDHLFAAAAESIQVKCLSDDDDDSEDPQSSITLSLKRTSTGILSNRRPTSGTPATSGSSTPAPNVQPTRPSLLVTAKRDAAKRGLYSRFFRGPILGPDTTIEGEECPVALVSERFTSDTDVKVGGIIVKGGNNVKSAGEVMTMVPEVTRSKGSRKRRKGEDEDWETEEARRERKRRRKEGKEKLKGREKKRKDFGKEKARLKDLEMTSEGEASSKERHKESKAKSPSTAVDDEPPIPLDSNHDLSKAGRKKRKEEKKRLKALGKNVEETKINQSVNSDSAPSHKRSKSRNKGQTIPNGQEVEVEKAKKKKKKRKLSDEGEG